MLSMSHTAPATTSDASSSRIGPARLNAQDTFAALDEQNPPGSPVWIHTGGNKAEAGFKDPTLGWIGVRAQVDAGGVHASVVTGSALASQALSSNMTNLSAYLDEQHTPVQSLTMATSESSWEGRNADNSSSTNAGQGNAQEGNSGQQQASSNSVASAVTVAQDRFIQTTDPIESSLAYLATGAKYISVIA
jgi:putative intracellular protease/amidase